MPREGEPKFNPKEKDLRDESEIIEKAKNGDKLAFEKLVRKYDGQLKKFILYKTRSPQEVEDIAQTTWLKALNNISKFNKGSFKSWIFTIAFRNFLNYKRTEKINLKKGGEEFEENIHFDAKNAKIVGELNSTEKKIEEERIKSKLDSIIEKLDYQEQGVVRGRQEDRDHEEIAKREGLKNKQRSRKIFHEAKQKIKAMLSDMGIGKETLDQ